MHREAVWQAITSALPAEIARAKAESKGHTEELLEGRHDAVCGGPIHQTAAARSRRKGGAIGRRPLIAIAASIIGVTIGRLLPEHEKKLKCHRQNGPTRNHLAPPRPHTV
jgi:hypothetical protein